MTTQHLTGDGFLALLQSQTALAYQSGTWGGEWAGACPFCGGRDRFRAWPAQGKWSCRSCYPDLKQHTDVDFVLIRDTGTIPDTTTRDGKRAIAKAFEALGSTQTSGPPAQRADPEPKPCTTPSDLWKKAGNGFWEYAFRQLWDVPHADRATHPAHQYLATRGVSDDVLAWACVGYNPVTRYSDPAKWGVERTFETPHKEVWLPAGLVFPWLIDGVIWKLVVRPDEGAQAGKYIVIEGSSNPPYGLHTIEPGRPLVLVEGVFDYLAVCQATNAHEFSSANHAIGCCATGTTWARHMAWALRFTRASQVLTAHDNEPPHEGKKLSPGDEAARYWQDVLGSKARRHLPTRKDCGEMAQHNDDVLQWIQEGLSK